MASATSRAETATAGAGARNLAEYLEMGQSYAVYILNLIQSFTNPTTFPKCAEQSLAHILSLSLTLNFFCQLKFEWSVILPGEPENGRGGAKTTWRMIGCGTSGAFSFDLMPLSIAS